MKQQTTFKSFIAIMAIVLLNSSYSIAQERNRIAFAELGYTNKGFLASTAFKLKKNAFVKASMFYIEQKSGILVRYKHYIAPSLNIHFENPNKKISPFLSVGIGYLSSASSSKSGNDFLLGLPIYTREKIQKGIQYPIMFGLKQDIKDIGKLSLTMCKDNAEFGSNFIYGFSVNCYLEKTNKGKLNF